MKQQMRTSYMRLSRIRQQRRNTLYRMQEKRHGCVRCYVCKQPVAREDATLEHIVPLSRGGNDDMENLAISHAACNSRKGDKVSA